MTKRNDAAWKALTNDLAALWIEAVGESTRASNGAEVLACWEIGRRLEEAEQVRRFGDHLVERVAAELCGRLGPGFSRRSLSDMRRLTRQWPREALDGALGFSHYRELMRVDDATLRHRLEAAARTNALSKNDLRALIDAAGPRPGARGAARRSGGALARPAGELGLAKVVTLPDGGGGRPALDLGFQIGREVGAAFLRGAPAGAVVRLPAPGGRAVMLTDRPTRSYLFAAWLERVVDGDTLIAQVELGLGVVLRQRLRLRGVDAAELGTAAGAQAHRSLTRRLANARRLVLATHGTDRFDRYVADVLFTPGGHDPEAILATGRFLNEELALPAAAARAERAGPDAEATKE